MGLVHRDIKPQNLLFVKPNTPSSPLSNEQDGGPCISFKNYLLKVADFGFARQMNPLDMADTMCGSPLYMAPEILQNEKYDAKADLWSVGCIMFELLFARGPPFRAPNHFALAKKYQDPELVERLFHKLAIEGAPEIWASLSEDCISLLKGLLTVDPLRRISFDEFFSHKWLTLLPSMDIVKELKNDDGLQPQPYISYVDNTLSSFIEVIHIDPLNAGSKSIYGRATKSNIDSVSALRLFPSFLQNKHIHNRILYSIQVFLVKLRRNVISITHFQLIVHILAAIEEILQVAALLSYSEIFNKGRYLFLQYLRLADNSESSIKQSKLSNNMSTESIFKELLYEIDASPGDTEWLKWLKIKIFPIEENGLKQNKI